MENNLDHHLDRALLQEEIRQTLRETVFSSGLNISPRQAGQVAQDMVDAFFQYYTSENDVLARAQGERLAMDGLGVGSILAATETLNRFSRQRANPLQELPDVAGRYVTNLLEGYITAREQVLLQEQERTFQALLRAQDQRGREDG